MKHTNMNMNINMKIFPHYERRKYFVFLRRKHEYFHNIYELRIMSLTTLVVCNTWILTSRGCDGSEGLDAWSGEAVSQPHVACNITTGTSITTVSLDSN